MKKRQAFNPYLPLNVCIPDGEPHVFGDRVYVYGSHDREGGDAFCVLDYEVFSAPVCDLADWRSEGISYRADQDPDYSEKYRHMYAPDVVQGGDGRYYLYYAMSGGCFTGPIHVAVSDGPAGPFSYYGEVRNRDGSAYRRNITFDPAVINDDGVIRLYYGWSLAIEQQRLAGAAADPGFGAQLKQVQMQMFEKTEEELAGEPEGVMGAFTVELAADMLTVKTEPVRIVPGQFDSLGTEYEGHAFFEASSIRKIGETYYFVYSSQVCHELCYAVSSFPDRDFTYGGVIVSNGDIGYQGRAEQDRLAMTGNNHGGLVCAEGQWYIFYHRQTHKTSYSRQGCAERIRILPDGSIPQVEMTSCGLNGGPLRAEGVYPAPIACNLTNGHMPQAGTGKTEEILPFITDDGTDRYIADIEDGTLVGYKYFEFAGETELTLTVRGEAEGRFLICLDEEQAGEIPVSPARDWTKFRAIISGKGVRALYLKYQGAGRAELLSFGFCANPQSRK